MSMSKVVSREFVDVTCARGGRESYKRSCAHVVFESKAPSNL
jgi:hypothetical protein